MRSSIIVVLIVCIGFVTACEKTASTDKTESEETSASGLKVKLNDCVNTIVAGNNIKLCFDSLIAESRCPSDVVCVWQGFATGKFSFHLNDDIHTFKLSTLKMGNVLIKDTTISGYKIELLNLDPYPRTTSLPVPASKYKAVVKITKP